MRRGYINTKSWHYSAAVSALCARLHELTKLWKYLLQRHYKGRWPGFIKFSDFCKKTVWLFFTSMTSVVRYKTFFFSQRRLKTVLLSVYFLIGRWVITFLFTLLIYVVVAVASLNFITWLWKDVKEWLSQSIVSDGV